MLKMYDPGRTLLTTTGISVLSLFLLIHCVTKCAVEGIDSNFSYSSSMLETESFTENSTSVNDTMTEITSCGNRPWLIDSEDTCECADSLDGIIYCDTSRNVFIKSQFCMSLYRGYEVVGRCPYTYVKYNDPDTASIGLFYKAPNHTQDLERALCGRLNRRGLLCGKCNEGYGHAIYPVFTRCVECPPELHAQNWVLYFVLSYVPLTIFLILVVCLKINAASAPLNTFVFISQVATQPPLSRGFIHTINSSTFLPDSAKVFMRFLFSLYGIWNLDFFVVIIPSFCLPKLTVFSAISLTYAVAFYPLLLLILLYISIELHSRDFKLFLWLGKPFHVCYVRCKRHWDIRASIVDAFATFFLLSYVKLLFISFDLLSPSRLMNKNGSFVELVSYFDASFPVTAEPRTVLTIMGIILLLILFTVLPIVMLLLYPCRFCKSILTRIKLNFRSLHFLMYSFNVCYKDGTDGTPDRRSFAALFLAVRLLISIEYVLLYFNYLTSIMITCTAFMVVLSVVQPYNARNSIFNRLDPLMIFFLIVWLAMFNDLRASAGNHVLLQHSSVALCCISLLLPLILVAFYLFRNVTIFKKCWKSSKSHEKSLDLSLEQRTTLPYVLQSGYISSDLL